MQDAMPEPISVDGIKLSAELAWLDLSANAEEITGFLQDMARNHINLPFLTTSLSAARVRLCCCVDGEAEGFARQILRRRTNFDGKAKCLSPVGSLSIFPHRKDLRLLGCLLSALSSAQLPVYGAASSVSSLTFVTDFGILDSAVEVVSRCVRLPGAQTVRRPELRIRQQPQVRPE